MQRQGRDERKQLVDDEYLQKRFRAKGLQMKEVLIAEKEEDARFAVLDEYRIAIGRLQTLELRERGEAAIESEQKEVKERERKTE